ncbi:MAG: hypothetical protein BWK78_07205 [Thiotrichaceae bacterium IS1]|nr:MAG: hypothetical protein BWK78_07205 [Thiotrichaceae bacterium IS1]
MFSSQGYVPVEGDIEVTPPETATFTTILEVSQAYAGIGIVSGRVINAFNNAGVDAVTLNVRSGVNVSSGNIVATTITDNSGNYTVRG